MKDSGRHRGIGSALVCALFAVGLLLVASLQPGMVAMAKSAMHSAQSQTVQDIEPHDHDAAHASHETSAPSDVNHHGDASTADLCCDTVSYTHLDVYKRQLHANLIWLIGKEKHFIKSTKSSNYNL